MLLHAALSTTATASEMARAMARPIPRDAPVIITSDLLMVILGGPPRRGVKTEEVASEKGETEREVSM